jgi:hypothetical protein
MGVSGCQEPYPLKLYHLSKLRSPFSELLRRGLGFSQEPADHGRRTGPALEATYRFILWLVPTVEKFPRSQKFLLGDRIQSTALDVLEGVVEAT